MMMNHQTKFGGKRISSRYGKKEKRKKEKKKKTVIS